MSTRAISGGMSAGILTPNNWDKMLSVVIGDVVHYGYYLKNGQQPDIFLMRVEQEEVAGVLVRAESFPKKDGIFP